jgi:endonuclease III related protein
MRREDPRETRRLLLRVYRRLRAKFGHAGWWPGDSPFEVCVGAILVQNTAWVNVERTLRSLRARGLLSYEALSRLPVSRLAPLLRSSGTFRVKARRLRAFLDFLGAEWGGRAGAMRAEEPLRLREKLLRVHGVGPETADSIALYAAGHPLFVVDAYTRRFFSRLGLLHGREPYDDVRRFFEGRLPRDAGLYGDFHAQVVRLAKDICRPRPRCPECPLEGVCPHPEGVRPGRRPRESSPFRKAPLKARVKA